jgi:hypothetical protein
MLEHTAADSTQNIANRELREALALIKKHITEENSQQNHDLYQAMQLVVDASRRVGLWQDPESKPEVGVRNRRRDGPRSQRGQIQTQDSSTPTIRATKPNPP